MEMRFVEPARTWPHASITGRTGPLLDTGWDIHWPGPGRVYLHGHDLAEIVYRAHQHEEVAAVLKDAGWVAPDDHQARVAELEQQAADAERRAQESAGKLEQALATIQLVNQAAADNPAADTPKPAARARKKTE